MVMLRSHDGWGRVDTPHAQSPVVEVWAWKTAALGPDFSPAGLELTPHGDLPFTPQEAHCSSCAMGAPPTPSPPSLSPPALHRTVHPSCP